MVVKKDNGKVKMELTKDELIIKGMFKDKKIKIKDIRSAYLTDNNCVILTYDYKITYIPTTKVKWSFREQLKLLVDEINKEDIVFKSSYMEKTSFFPFCYLFFIPWANNFDKNIWLSIIISAFYIFISAFLIWDAKRFKGVIYDINTKTFTRVGYKNFNKETFKIDDIEFVKRKELGLLYEIKKSGYKFYLQSNLDKIEYPVRHGHAVKEIENYFTKTEIIN